MEALVHWFSQNLSQYISPEGAVFIISMIPLLELRGGLLAASLLKISAAKAIPLCIVGNIIPIPFIRKDEKWNLYHIKLMNALNIYIIKYQWNYFSIKVIKIN